MGQEMSILRKNCVLKVGLKYYPERSVDINANAKQKGGI